MPISPAPQFVVKVSKYCNLRCDYCYEFSQLGDKTRMSLDNIQAMFANVVRSFEDLETVEADFIWHGGEPLLIPIEFYQQVAQIQKELLGTKFAYRNIVQTNLTVLTDRHIDFLKDGFFSDIGVSFDVYGDQRIDTKGRQPTDVVLGNLQKLVDHDIGFGAIAVLARNTLPHIEDIYAFYDDLNVQHRILPYYQTADSAQAERHGLEFDELVGALKSVFHAWLASETATSVKPIDDYVSYAISRVSDIPRGPYVRSEEERVFIIDVNGDVFSDVEPYDTDFCFGNLFRSPLSEIVASESRRHSNALSQERMQRVCQDCPHFGYCPGVFVANATCEQRKLLEARGCPVRAMLDYIIDIFEHTEIKDSILNARDAARTAKAHPALSVA